MSDINTYADEAAITDLTPINGDLVLNRDNNSLYLCTDSSASGIARWKKFTNDSVEVPLPNRWGASFDGTNDYLDLSSLNSTISSIGTGAVTISMWVKFDNSIPSFSGFLHFGNADAFSDYFYCRYNSGSVEFQSRAGTSGVANILTSVSKNVWYNLVFIRSGTTGTLYVDENSSSVTNAEFGADFSNNTNNFMRVGSNRTNTQAGKVLVDEVAVFNSALSASDLTAIYNSGVPGDISSLNPIGWWRMGDDSNDSPSTDPASNKIATITDSSGNGNHATQSTAASQPTFSALASSETIYS